MAPRLLEFAGARNQALLDVGMGLGEYTWIYWLTYHAWLGHPVGDSLLNEIMEASAESERLDADAHRRHGDRARRAAAAS